MLDDSNMAVNEVARLVEEIAARSDLPSELKLSMIYKARRYLQAIFGDIDAARAIFAGLGLDDFDAEAEAIDDLLARHPRGEFHAAKTVLEEWGSEEWNSKSSYKGQHGWRIAFSAKGEQR